VVSGREDVIDPARAAPRTANCLPRSTRGETLAAMRSLTIACALAASAGACGDPAPILLDAAPLCGIPGDYGALGTTTGTQDATGTGTPSITVVLDPGPPKDDLFIKLITGKGAFTAGITPGTFTIGGADASFADCGLCTNILANIDPAAGPAKFYFTDAGTVTIATTNPVSGSAHDLHFVEINLATGTATPGGCTATIASLTFGSP
jgi:hypothetical protein